MRPHSFSNRFGLTRSFGAALAVFIGAVSFGSLGACASSEEQPSGASGATGPDAGAAAPTGDGGNVGTDGSVGPKPPVSEITFGASTTFEKRSCSLSLQYAGTASSVKVAGEFTNWESGAIALAKTGATYSVTLTPGASLKAGELYAYKLIVDGNWILDPAGKYRKIVSDTMNSGLRMPACDAGPEITSGLVDALPSGDTKVRVTVRSASDGARPAKLVAKLDRQPIPADAFSVDEAKGAVDFSFKGLTRGKHRLSLQSVDEKNREADPVDLPFWVEEQAFDYRDGVLYMFVIDRFANGDPANDKPIGAPVDYDADWHGGDLQGALKVLESGYFEKLGVRTIWLSPLNEQTGNAEKGDGDQWYSAYHGYWPTRARNVEPRFGGDAALRAFVDAAHKRGLRVLLDLINNQVYKTHEYVGPHASFFRNSCKCGDDANACGWSQRPFDCMFQFYLPDINWRDAAAEKQFVSDAVHWISEYDFDGFRVDAVKHVEPNAVYNMRAELTRRFEQGGSRIFMVGETAVGQGDSGSFFGEYFADGYKWIDAYVGPTALDGQFDFPTRHNMADGLVSGAKPLSEVEAEIKKAEQRYKPGNRNVMFLNGHDNPRIASIAAGDSKLGCTWASGCRGDQLPPLAYDDDAVYQRLKRALTVLYTLPGVPYLYAGDEVGFGGGADPDMRRNMLFKEGLEAVEMAAPTQQPKPLTNKQLDLREWVRKLGATRNASRALHLGDRITLVGNEADFWAYAYQAAPGELALVVVNRGGAAQRSIPTGALSVGSTTWKAALGTGSAVTNGANIDVVIGAGEAAIFVPN